MHFTWGCLHSWRWCSFPFSLTCLGPERQLESIAFHAILSCWLWLFPHIFSFRGLSFPNLSHFGIISIKCNSCSFSLPILLIHSIVSFWWSILLSRSLEHEGGFLFLNWILKLMLMVCVLQFNCRMMIELLYFLFLFPPSDGWVLINCNLMQTTHVAAQYGQTAFLYHIVSKWNADPDVPDNDGRSPLHWYMSSTYTLLLFTWMF